MYVLIVMACLARRPLVTAFVLCWIVVLALQCLVEVAQIELDQAHQPVIVEMFAAFMQQLAAILSLEADFESAYSAGSEEDVLFLNKLALFFTTLFRVCTCCSYRVKH